jgi:hypothetical protein
MENPERNASSRQLEKWTEECTALLAPAADWEPNLTAALARFEARLHQRFRLRRYLLVGATAGLLACIVLPAILPTRAVAQQIASNSLYRLERFWYWINFVRMGTIMLLPSGLPEEVKSFRTHPISEHGAPQMVSDTAEAALLVGFVPRLPQSSVLSSRPRLSVLGPTSFGTIIRTANLELALRNAGVSDEDIPKAWDGTQIALNIGSTVTAEWSNVPDEWSGEIEWSRLTLMQSPPPVLTSPPGFDLAAFTVINLRTARMRNREYALRFAQRTTTAPALLLGGGMQNVVGVRELILQRGVATLIEDFGALSDGNNWLGPKVERIILIWSVPDRVYVLSGRMSVPRAMMGVDLAAALTNAIDLANTIE